MENKFILKINLIQEHYAKKNTEYQLKITKLLKFKYGIHYENMNFALVGCGRIG